jgi:cytochrome bd ubiquinol oxidase subunit II
MAFIVFWFVLITVLWMGFFVLEGFDLGVGMLHGVVGGDDDGRRAVINTIGPLWDGNEVWLIVAAAAIFAAFPGWYATWLSGLYLAFVILLVALIARGVSFEYRSKSPAPQWRRFWSRALVTGSLLVPLVIGIALGDLLNGLPINAHQDYTGSFGNLFQPYAVMTGVTLVALCALHGATFITLKTTDVIRQRAGRWARRIAPVTMLLTLAWICWTHAIAVKGALLNPIELIVFLAVIAAAILVYEHREGWAFTATTITISFSILAVFVDLYPRVMVSSTSPAYSLTVHNTASPPYTLKVMTVVGLVLLPFVLAYQAWTYYVFRRRVSVQSVRPAPPAAPPEPQMAAVPTQRAATPPGDRADARPRRRGWLARTRHDRRGG